jgi:hypothetical protein
MENAFWDKRGTRTSFRQFDRAGASEKLYALHETHDGTNENHFSG